MNTYTIDNTTFSCAADLDALTAKQLVALYNKVTGSKLVKFQTKTSGVQRTWSAIVENVEADKVEEAEPTIDDVPTIEAPNMTDAEFACLVACMTYSDRETQLEDNMTQAGHNDFKALLGWNDKAVSALIGSLEKKGLAYSDNEGVNGEHFNLVWPSELGVKTVFDALDAGREVVDIKQEQKAEPKPKAASRQKGVINLMPGAKAYACRAGTKQAALIDALAEGATMADLVKVCSEASGGKKSWSENSVKSGIYWDVNKVKGYGVRTEFDTDGTPRYFLTLPKGHSAPVEHKQRKADTEKKGETSK